jgi:hypothetical protein
MRQMRPKTRAMRPKTSQKGAARPWRSFDARLGLFPLPAGSIPMPALTCWHALVQGAGAACQARFPLAPCEWFPDPVLPELVSSRRIRPCAVLGNPSTRPSPKTQKTRFWEPHSHHTTPKTRAWRQERPGGLHTHESKPSGPSGPKKLEVGNCTTMTWHACQ